jgi:hypothetical protein
VSQCPQCGITFNPASPRQRFCTPVCQIKQANRRRATTRSGRVKTPEATRVPSTVKTLGAPPLPAIDLPRATISQLFGQWFVRVDGWLALGPLPQSQAQERADAMNKETMK